MGQFFASNGDQSFSFKGKWKVESDTEVAIATCGYIYQVVKSAYCNHVMALLLKVAKNWVTLGT